MLCVTSFGSLSRTRRAGLSLPVSTGCLAAGRSRREYRSLTFWTFGTASFAEPSSAVRPAVSFHSTGLMKSTRRSGIAASTVPRSSAAACLGRSACLPFWCRLTMAKGRGRMRMRVASRTSMRQDKVNMQCTLLPSTFPRWVVDRFSVKRASASPEP